MPENAFLARSPSPGYDPVQVYRYRESPRIGRTSLGPRPAPYANTPSHCFTVHPAVGGKRFTGRSSSTATPTLAVDGPTSSAMELFFCSMTPSAAAVRRDGLLWMAGSRACRIIPACFPLPAGPISYIITMGFIVLPSDRRTLARNLKIRQDNPSCPAQTFNH
jgi:hypothetical protein